MARRTIDDIRAGDTYAEEVVVTPERLARFLELSRDTSSVHVDTAAAKEQGYDALLVHGFLVSLYFSRIIGMELPGENAVIGSIELRFHAPVYVGETATFAVTVHRVLRPLGSVALDLHVRKPDGTLCVEGRASCIFRR